MADTSNGSSRDAGPALPTSLVDGRYHVERIISQGAFSRVFLAFDARLRHSVAIKELLAIHQQMDSPAYTRYLDRFEREARAARLMRHPNIVTIYDLAVDASGNYYLVMEYVEGVNLRELLERTSPLPVERTIVIARAVARALEAAHAQDIVHRDLKPANIMIGGQGTVKLMDFGVAQVGHESARSVQPADHPGTPIHMSPEQRSQTAYLDGRSDLYSLGTIVYEMLVGEPYARKRLSLRSARPDLPLALDAVVNKLLTWDANARYPHAGDVVRDLDRIALGLAAVGTHSTDPLLSAAQLTQEQRAVARGMPSAYGGPPSGGAPGVPESSGAVPARRPRRGRWIGAAVGLVAALAALAFSVRFVIGPHGTVATTTVPATLASGMNVAADRSLPTPTRQSLVPLNTLGEPASAAPAPATARPTATAIQQTVMPVPTATLVRPTATPINAHIVYTPDFKNFHVVSTSIASGQVDPATGEYLLHVTGNSSSTDSDTIVRSFDNKEASFQDFIVEVDAHAVDAVGDGGYGLTFRSQPNVGDTYPPSYNFIIYPTGFFALVLVTKERDPLPLYLQQPLFSPVIKRGTAMNHLQVICIGDTITLEINGTIVGTYTATLTDPGSVAVFVLNPRSAVTTAAFKDLRVSLPS